MIDVAYTAPGDIVGFYVSHFCRTLSKFKVLSGISAIGRAVWTLKLDCECRCLPLLKITLSPVNLSTELRIPRHYQKVA